jgi:GntR family transcriptional regulator, transcriptional repressor for pyruvate dehydrogenase complex
MGTLPEVIDRISDEDIERLAGHVARMESALTAHEAAQADYAFHLTLVEASGNAVVRKLYHVLAQTIIFYMEIGKAVPRHDRKIIAGHGAMVDALRRRSLPDLMKTGAAHYDYSEGVLDETIQRNAAKDIPA